MSTTTTPDLTPPSAAPAPQKETVAGNYFVSNYPPFSFWKPDCVPELEAALDRPPQPDTPLGLYVHIPFCRKRCHFCYFKVYTDKDATAIRGYLDAMLRELELYAGKPFAGGRPLDFVYFGGGTPSYLSAEQLNFLAEGLKRHLPWDAAQEVTFEAEPGTLTEHKLRAIRELGVTRLSLGVENFDDHILEINGRAHLSREIGRAYRAARQLDFAQINVDLIAGMVEETDANWRACVQRAIDLAPDSVTIYEMEIPYNTTIYQRMKAAGKLVAPVADWETKRAWVRYAFETFERAGYSVASAYTVVRQPGTRFVYRDRLWAGADLLALGVASFGHLNGVHYQNQADFGPYLEQVSAGRRPVFRALTPTDDERLIREFVLQLKLGTLRRSSFKARFGADPAQRFAQPLRRLQDWGFMTVSNDEIQLNRDGLLQVDRLLPEFFLPQHRQGRYV
jgi:oxygen-independent coproporphyrinogen-3 oxidase